MSDEFNIREYLMSILDKDERAQTIIESGWVDEAEISDIVAAVADPNGGEYQQRLAAMRESE